MKLINIYFYVIQAWELKICVIIVEKYCSEFRFNVSYIKVKHIQYLTCYTKDMDIYSLKIKFFDSITED